MNIKVKRLSEKATLPIKATPGSACVDLSVASITTELNEVGELIIVYHTGLAIEIPNDYVGLLFMRSSVAKKPLSMCNAVGVIDSDFRGEITAKFRSTVPAVVPSVYNEKDRFVQLMILPIQDVEIEEVNALTDTERGEGGYGSTDNETTTSAPTGSQSLPETEVETINSETANEGSGDAENSVEEA